MPWDPSARQIGVGQMSSMMRIFLLVWVVLCPRLLALDPEWSLYQFGHRAWKIEDGYLGSEVNAFAQDKDGYLWVGTASGLFRFDGVSFTLWNPPGDSLPLGVVLSLLADRDGSLWIGSSDGLSHWDHHRLTRYKDRAGQFVYSLAQDESGAVWFAPYSFTEDEEDVFCRVAHEKLACYGRKDGIPRGPSLNFLRDASGTFWTARSDSLLSWREGGAAKVYELKQLRDNANQAGVTGLALDTDGSLLVGIGKQGPGLGLQRFRDGQFSTVTAPGFDGSRHRVISLFVDRHHALWMATADEGIYRLYQGKADHFGRLDGLSAEFARAIFEDHEGSIWIATADGLDQLRDLATRRFSRTVYPQAHEFDNLVTLPDGRMWVGGDGILYTLAGNGNQFVSQAKGIEGKQVTTIFGDREGRVWIGLDNTLNLFSEGRLLPVRMTDGRPAGFIVSMAEDAAGGLFAVTAGPPRTLLSIDAKSMGALAVLPALDASKIAADPHEGIWIGTNTGGIQHLAKGAIASYAIGPQPGTRIAQLAVMPSGEVMASGDFGLASFSDGVFHLLSMANGLPCTYVNSFLFDGSGNLWLYMGCGLVKLSAAELQQWRRDNHAQLSPRFFDSADGFKVALPPFEGAARSPDGRLWFNNQQSLMMVDPMHMHVNTLPPPVHIQGVRADFREYAFAEDMKLPALTRDIEIDHAVLSFTAPEKIRSRYRLAGFDQQWHDVGARRQAVYMNLKPGTYSFQVISANNDGIWNLQGETFRFTIPPKFYQTNWFLACLAIGSMLLLSGAFVLRLRVSTQHVQERMNERLLERDRIARELHDTLLQGFHGIVLRLQGIAHLIPRADPARQGLEETMDRAEQILIDGRESLMQLRSYSGASPDLVEQLNRVVADLQSQSEIGCVVDVVGEMRPLKPAVQEEMLAMARESLTNAFRHSKAVMIRMELNFSPSQFMVRCTDDGIGLPADVLRSGSAEGRWGLVGLRERSENLNARLVVRKNEPQGAVVEISLRGRIAYAERRPRSIRQFLADLIG